MFKIILALWSVPLIIFAEDQENIGLIITNYGYDQWGRPVRSSSVQTNTQNNGYYYNNSPYYYDPYPGNLPGSDPNRFEDIFEQNSRR